MAGDQTGVFLLRAHAPHLYLLPHIEQGEVFKNVDFRAAANRELFGHPANPPANAAAQGTRLPVYLCPSDAPSFAAPGNNYRANIGVIAFARGPNVPRDPALRGHGAFAPPRHASSARSFSDGLSTTAAFSEKLIASEPHEPFDPQTDYFLANSLVDFNDILNSPQADMDLVNTCRSLSDPNPPRGFDAGRFWFFAGYEDTWYSHLLPPNDPTPDCGVVNLSILGGAVVTARSRHVGGVNCLMMDGSVRFVSNTIDIAVWQASGTRNGNEALGDY